MLQCILTCQLVNLFDSFWILHVHVVVCEYNGSAIRIVCIVRTL